MEHTKRDNTAVIILSIFLAYLTYIYIIHDVPLLLSDYHGHTHVYLPLFTGDTWLQGWKAVPYCMWHLCVLGIHNILHIPLHSAAAYVSIFFSLLSFYITYWILLKYTSAAGKPMHSIKAAFITFGLSIIQPLYLYWLDAGTRFLGSYSMNPLHNPTQMCARPFVLLCICLVYDIWNKIEDDSYNGVFFHTKSGWRGLYIRLAIYLFLSTLAKPTFSEMFIPAVAFIMLAEWIRRIRKKNGSASAYFQHCLHMLYCAVPSLLYILISFLAYFVLGGSYGAAEGGSLIITKWLEVWSMFTDNVTLSIALGLAFPLFVILLDLRFFLKDNLGRLALIGYGVSFLEAALLGESGIKLSHGDFMWPMLWGMAMLFLAATLHLSVLEKDQGNTRVKSFLIDAAWFIFWLHVLCGFLLIKQVVTG